MMSDGKFVNDHIEPDDPFDLHARALHCAVRSFSFFWRLDIMTSSRVG
jgi:hypothetical protein